MEVLMSSPIEPLTDNVVIQLEKTSAQTKSGIYVPANAQEKSKAAVVLAVGPEVKIVKVGDRVLYKENYDNDTYKLDNEEYIVVKEENIRGKLK